MEGIIILLNLTHILIFLKKLEIMAQNDTFDFKYLQFMRKNWFKVNLLKTIIYFLVKNKIIDIFN